MLQSPDITISFLAPYLAIDRHIEKHKAEYYVVLNRCSGGIFSNNPAEYNIEYFVLFMIKILEESLNDIAIYRKKYKSLQTLSGSAIKVLDCFKEHPELRLSTALICNSTLLPRRTVINALNSLLLEGLVQRYGKGSAVKYQLAF
jgi:Fic family protein